MSACVRDHGVRRALHGMRHQVGKIREDSASELDDIVVGDGPWLEVDDDARFEGPVEDEEIVAGVALQVVTARSGEQRVVAVAADEVVVAFSLR